MKSVNTLYAVVVLLFIIIIIQQVQVDRLRSRADMTERELIGLMRDIGYE